MTRKARKTSSIGIYHVMLRGINKQNIFETDSDYLYFIKLLEEVKLTRQDDGTVSPDACIIYSWVCMPNHVHLLVKEGKKTVGDIVKSLASAYVYYYNHKYDRIGHLFQDRFRSEPCEDENYFLTLFRYINQNPVKAGIVNSVDDYQWCSWTFDYLTKHLDPSYDSICYTDAVLSLASFEGIEDLVMEICQEKQQDFQIEQEKSDDIIKNILSEHCGCISPSDFQKMRNGKLSVAFSAACKNHASLRQLSRITGLTIYQIRKEIKKGQVSNS